MGRPPIRTKNGYDLGEVVSALQKSIRRGEEYQALYWAAEMYKSGYKSYIWKRLFVIVNEDIGVANSSLIHLVWNLYQMAEWFKKKNKMDDHDCLFICHAIIKMCRSPKCRMNDHAACLFFYSSTQLPRLEMPDYALDMHTRRGKQMKRGLEHFWEEGALLNPVADVEDPYFEKYIESWKTHEATGGAIDTQVGIENGQSQLFDTDIFNSVP